VTADPGRLSEPNPSGELSPTVRLSDCPTLREQPVADPAVPRMELRDWADRYGVVAGVTTRGAGRGFSLGLWSEENVGQVMTRWRALRAAFRPAFSGLVLSHQIHGTTVQWHRAGQEGWLILDGVDGHATGSPGVLLTVTVADCIPVYLVAPTQRVVALLHAGWRGTAGGMLQQGVELLRREAFVTAPELVMHCGVGICGSCYEVGSEVLERLTPGRSPGVNRLEEGLETPPGTPGHRPGVSRPGDPADHVDLRGVLVRQAAELGITGVSVSPWCSAHDREHFFSHRASGGRDGRMIAYLGVPA